MEAAAAAANIYNPPSVREDREYMGAIYKVEGGFRFAVTAGGRRAGKSQIALPEEGFDKVVAFWHTHCNADSLRRYFSDVDTKTVNEFGRPPYRADYSGYLKGFEPGGSVLSAFSARHLGLPAARGYATGELVKDKSRRSVRVATRSDGRFS